MKKNICILLALILCISTVFAGEKTYLTREEIPLATTSADILKSLGILIGTPNGLELEREVTRAEMVVLLFRMYPENFGALGLPSPVFDDMTGHWAYKEVTIAKKIGLVHGISDTLFAPDRNVTGKEATKMILSLLGYTNVTIENAYDLAIDAELINNNFTKSVVYNNYPLLRSDVARLTHSALLAKCKSGEMLKEKLVKCGKFTEDDFSVLTCGTPAASTFAE